MLISPAEICFITCLCLTNTALVIHVIAKRPAVISSMHRANHTAGNPKQKQFCTWHGKPADVYTRSKAVQCMTGVDT